MNDITKSYNSEGDGHAAKIVNFLWFCQLDLIFCGLKI